VSACIVAASPYGIVCFRKWSSLNGVVFRNSAGHRPIEAWGISESWSSRCAFRQFLDGRACFGQQSARFPVLWVVRVNEGVADELLQTARYYGTCVHYTDFRLEFNRKTERLGRFLGGVVESGERKGELAWSVGRVWALGAVGKGLPPYSEVASADLPEIRFLMLAQRVRSRARSIVGVLVRER